MDGRRVTVAQMTLGQIGGRRHDLLAIGSWPRAKEQGKLRVEGKDYEVQDGDVLEIRFNV